MPNDEDAAAVARVLGGDTEAFRTLVDAYGGRLYGMCLARLGDPEEAEDAVQDVFARAFRSLGSFDPSRSFAAWLFSIAANRVKSRYSSRSSRAALLESMEREAAVAANESVDPSAIALDALAAEALRAAVAALPRRYRAPVELYYFAGLSVAETSAALGVGDEAIKSRLFRARKALSDFLGSDGQPKSRSKGRR